MDAIAFHLSVALVIVLLVVAFAAGGLAVTAYNRGRRS